MIIENLEKVR